jgi:hypothetical protein
MAPPTEDVPFCALSRFGVVFNETGAARLLTALHESAFAPQVIIVDTYRRVSPGDENEAKDVSKFWRHVEPILKAGITLVVIHHMRKPRSQHEGGRHRASGSTDITAGTDVAFALERGQDDHNTIRVECTKAREAEEVSRFVVRLRDDGNKDGAVVFRYDGPAKGFAAETPRVDDWIPVVEELLRKEPKAATGAILADLEARGCPRRTGERTIEVMEKQARIEKVAHGVWRLRVHPSAAA